MRRWVWTISILIVLGLGFWAWPFIGAAQLVNAANQGDTAGVMARVDVPALRRSLARAIGAAYLAASGKADKLGAFGRSVAGAAATSVADPYLDTLLTPDAITRLLGHGKIDEGTLGGKAVKIDRTLPSLPDFLHSDAFSMLTGSYFDGVVDFVILVPAAPQSEDTYGLHLRLAGLTWQLAGLDLPKPVLDDIAKSVLGGQHDNAL